MKETVLGDLSMEQSLSLFYSLFGHDPQLEPGLETLAERGFSPEYVYHETRRAAEDVRGDVTVYAAIGMDIPRGSGWGGGPWHRDAKTVYRATLRAFEAGAKGVVASREYGEITLSSLRAMDRAIRDSSE
jgi:hypothetical protein